MYAPSIVHRAQLAINPDSTNYLGKSQLVLTPGYVN